MIDPNTSKFCACVCGRRGGRVILASESKYPIDFPAKFLMMSFMPMPDWPNWLDFQVAFSTDTIDNHAKDGGPRAV